MMKMYECKLCGYKGTRKSARKHYRENHFWKDEKVLSSKIKNYEFK